MREGVRKVQEEGTIAVGLDESDGFVGIAARERGLVDGVALDDLPIATNDRFSLIVAVEQAEEAVEASVQRTAEHWRTEVVVGPTVEPQVPLADHARRVAAIPQQGRNGRVPGLDHGLASRAHAPSPEGIATGQEPVA